MKSPVVLASLLVVVPATAKNANAAISGEQVKDELRRAICFQDWDKATDLSSDLIASPTITPEHRHTLVDWRYRFSDYATDKTQFSEIPNCEGVEAEPVEIEVQVYQDSTPRFSNYVSYAPDYACYRVDSSGYVQNLEHMCNQSNKIAQNPGGFSSSGGQGSLGSGQPGDLGTGGSGFLDFEDQFYQDNEEGEFLY